MLLYDFQKKVYQNLNVTDVKAVAKGIYDYIPEGSKFPYIIIGEDRADSYNTKTEKGKEITTTIYVWAESRGMLDVKKLLGLIEEKLAKDLDIFEFHEIETIEASRESVEYVQGTIIIKYRIEV